MLPRPATEDRSPWVWLALLALVLGVGLRLPGLASEPFWFDEVMTIRHLEGTPWTVIKGVLVRVDPPLYYAGMAFWIPTAGTSELALRLPSFLAGVAALPLLWFAARAAFGARVAALATLALAVHPQAILYSQEARFYAALVLLGILATAAWDRLVHGEADRRKVLVYALLAAALFYAHFVAGTLVAAHGAHLLLGRSLGIAPANRRAAWRALFGFGLLCGPYLLGIGYLYLFHHAGHREWIHVLGGKPGPAELLQTLGFLSGADGPLPGAGPSWLAALRAALFGFAALGCAFALETARGTRRSRLVLHLGAVLVPIAILWAVSQTKSIYLDRYLIASLPSATLLGAVGFEAWWRGRLALPAALAAAACVLGIFLPSWPALRKSDWPGALRRLWVEADAQDLLLVEGACERPDTPYPGDLHITTCRFYVERLGAEGTPVRARIVPLPFGLLAPEVDPATLDPRRAEERELARSILEREVLPHRGRVFIALPTDPYARGAAAEAQLRAPTETELRAERGEPGVEEFQRLRLLRFAAR